MWVRAVPLHSNHSIRSVFGLAVHLTPVSRQAVPVSTWRVLTGPTVGEKFFKYIEQLDLAMFELEMLLASTCPGEASGSHLPLEQDIWLHVLALPPHCMGLLTQITGTSAGERCSKSTPERKILVI